MLPKRTLEEEIVLFPKNSSHPSRVTSQVKGYPFEVLLPSGQAASGAVPSDQVKKLGLASAKGQAAVYSTRRSGGGSAGKDPGFDSEGVSAVSKLVWA
jgi:hypothetical protein